MALSSDHLELSARLARAIGAAARPRRDERDAGGGALADAGTG
jgi:hypothetical protein